MLTSQTIFNGPSGRVALSPRILHVENRFFKGTKGVSQENHRDGFLPAFKDHSTGVVYLSRFADGRLAPMHLLDGLPDQLVLSRSASGRILEVSPFVEAGFVRDDIFYTREQARRAVDSPSRGACS